MAGLLPEGLDRLQRRGRGSGKGMMGEVDELHDDKWWQDMEESDLMRYGTQVIHAAKPQRYYRDKDGQVVRTPDNIYAQQLREYQMKKHW